MSISRNKLFEFVIAAILRESGYVAGVPTHFLRGRGAKHQIDAVGIEFKKVPYQYDTILITEAKCYDPNSKPIGLEVVRGLKSVLLDLEQTLPQSLSLIPRGNNPRWYFTDYLGNDGIKITANYHGAIFSTIDFSNPAKEFAYAHGIFLFYFPRFVSGRKVTEWMDDLLSKLKELSENKYRLRDLLNKRRKIEQYFPVLEKLFAKGYSELDASERHYLFTIIRGILEHDERFRKFWDEVRFHKIFDVNGYPVLGIIESKFTASELLHQVIDHFMLMAKKRYQKIGSRHEFGEFHLEAIRPPEKINAFSIISFKINVGKKRKDLPLWVPKTILSGRMYLPEFLVNKLDRKDLILTLPLREGIFLVAKMR